MTDNEIIKALECCAKTEFISDCAKCEMFAFDCKDILIENALDLINRQKAEIERLNIELQSMRSAANSCKMHYETAKSEAIKEFAERFAKANHDARVAKTPQRLKYAVEQLNQNGITYKVCNETTGQINCYFANGTVLTFYAGTGKIKGYENQQGIKSFIRICVAERDRK